MQTNKEGLTRAEFTNPSINNLKKGRFIVTGVVQGADPCIPMLKTLRRMAGHLKAELVFLPMRAHMRPMEGQPEYFHEYFYPCIERGEMVSEFVFNKNLKAADYHLNPQQILTLTGLERFTDTSLIVAHTKMFLKHFAVGNNGTPRLVHSTGVCTLGDYQTNRIGALADLDHSLGALLIELNGDTFTIRQLQCLDGETVIDLGMRYFPDGQRKRENARFLTLGDIHAGQHDDAALQMGKELAEILEPEFIDVHDLFNGVSVNHHIADRTLERAQLPSHINTLKKELDVTKEVLNYIASWSKAKINIVKSNHDDFLQKYLTSRRWITDIPNVAVAAPMFAQAIAGIDPLQTYLDPSGIYQWFNRETDFKLDGIQHACHGDLGPNGAKGNPENIEKAHGKATIGHTHSAFIYRGVWGAGHSSHTRHGYNKGASNWTHSHVIQYVGGERQIITLIKGKWRIESTRA